MTDIQPTYSGASALDRNLSARQLSTAHVTRVQNLERTPRWLHRLLPWVNVGGGVFRVNRRRIISSRFAGVVFSGQGNSIAPTSESLSFFQVFQVRIWKIFRLSVKHSSLRSCLLVKSFRLRMAVF